MGGGGGGGNGTAGVGTGGIDSSVLGNLNSSAVGSGNAIGVGAATAAAPGFNVEEAAMMESLQRRRLLLSAAQKEKQAINMLRESKELTQLAHNPINSTNNINGVGNSTKSTLSPDNSSFGEFSPGRFLSTGSTLLNDAGGNGNKGFVGGGGGGIGTQGDLDISGRDLDVISRREILSKLAGGGMGGGMYNNQNSNAPTVEDQLANATHFQM